MKKKYITNNNLKYFKTKILIGKEEINLSPVEFSYCRYFTKRANKENDFLKIDIDTTPEEFYKAILTYYRESFLQADSNRMLLEKNKVISSATFRANISKLNKKIKAMFDNNIIVKYYFY